MHIVFDENDERFVTFSDLVRRTRYFTIICICTNAHFNVNVLDLVCIHIFNVDITITLYLEHLRTSVARVDLYMAPFLTRA